MTVKDIITNSDVEINNNHESLDCNAVPASSSTKDAANRQPAFVFADEFIATFGDYDAEPFYIDNVADEDLPDEILAYEAGDSEYSGTGKRGDYQWYRIKELDIIFGVWGCSYTYDVMFNDDQDTNVKGWCASYDYCRNYIYINNGTNESYFEDYKGGVVSIVCNETEEDVYSEDIK